jgi:copper chaperone
MNETIELTVRGMDCAHCVQAVTQAIRSGDPGAQVVVELETGHVRATTHQPREQVASAIREEGYEVVG